MFVLSAFRLDGMRVTSTLTFADGPPTNYPSNCFLQTARPVGWSGNLGGVHLPVTTRVFDRHRTQPSIPRPRNVGLGQLTACVRHSDGRRRNRTASTSIVGGGSLRCRRSCRERPTASSRRVPPSTIRSCPFGGRSRAWMIATAAKNVVGFKLNERTDSWRSSARRAARITTTSSLSCCRARSPASWLLGSYNSSPAAVPRLINPKLSASN